MFAGFKGAAKRLESTDVSRIAAEIEVGEDELHAFMDVESSGHGFDKKGRVTCLFEPHVFYRELGPGKKRDRAVKEGLAYAKWRSGGYPTDSYPRLLAAMQIDETVALRSASWGLGQVMGFNCAAVGYATPQAMIKAFAADEENQLRAIVAFLKAKGLVKALKAHDWAKIERVYNGGGFRGTYAARMHAAFARWQQIKDIVWTPAPEPMPLLGGDMVTEPEDTPPALEEPAPPHTEPLVTERKPVLKHRRVWATIAGFTGGGGAFSLASLAAFEWQAVAVILGAAVVVALFFWWMYKREIDAGLFRP